MICGVPLRAGCWLDKVTRLCDKNIDESANLRIVILGRTNLIPRVASKSKPEGVLCFTKILMVKKKGGVW